MEQANLDKPGARTTREGSATKSPAGRGRRHSQEPVAELVTTEEVMARQHNAEAQSPAWWASAWSTIERTLDGNATEIRHRMDNMFSAQSQTTDCLGARLEAEAQRAKQIMKPVEDNFTE